MAAFREAHFSDTYLLGNDAPSTEKLHTAFAKRHGIARTFADVAAMMAAIEVAAVHLLVPPGLHRQLALDCLQRGLHVFVEKPLALTRHVSACVDR